MKTVKTYFLDGCKYEIRYDEQFLRGQQKHILCIWKNDKRITSGLCWNSPTAAYNNLDMFIDDIAFIVAEKHLNSPWNIILKSMPNKVFKNWGVNKKQ